MRDKHKTAALAALRKTLGYRRDVQGWEIDSDTDKRTSLMERLALRALVNLAIVSLAGKGMTGWRRSKELRETDITIAPNRDGRTLNFYGFLDPRSIQVSLRIRREDFDPSNPDDRELFMMYRSLIDFAHRRPPSERNDGFWWAGALCIGCHPDDQKDWKNVWAVWEPLM